MARKRFKNRVIGPKMRAAAEREESDGLVFPSRFQSPDKAALFDELAKSLAGVIPPAASTDQNLRTDNQSDSEKLVAELLKLVADVATGLWRLRSKMVPGGTQQLPEENRRSYKQVEAILDVLTDAGVEIRDHTGEAVPQGGIYGLDVLAYEPIAGLAREQVIETIKPTIYLKNGVIQIGQVIIGTPETSANSVVS